MAAGQGESNTIAFNGGVGVAEAPGSTGNSIRGNSIHDNALGISVDPSKWPFPVLSAAGAGASTVMQGTLHSTPSSTFTIDFYANPAPDSAGNFEGQTYLGYTTVTTDSTGYASFTASGLAPASLGQGITATATLTTYDANNNPIYLDTSEFSQDVQVTQALTTTTLTASPTSPLFGVDTVTLTASVSVPSGGVTPTGRVDFRDTTTGADLGSAPLSPAGVATLSTPTLGIGRHAIAAVYSGDANDQPSTSALTTVTVLRPPASPASSSPTSTTTARSTSASRASPASRLPSPAPTTSAMRSTSASRPMAPAPTSS